MATIKDVAKLAGVSVSTISKYINGGNVRAENVESIKSGAALMALQAGISEEIHQEREDEELDVIVEGFDEENPALAVGRSYHEAPDIDGNIFIENAAELEVGQMVRVRILQGFTYEMVAELV